ncbi:CHRD domain-containing protein [Aphanothece sacrum]|nr:CHRD domain-containing protein [Aphanothece sacrum]
MKNLLKTILLAVTIMVIAPVSQTLAATMVFTANLTGANEDPPNASPGLGTAIVTLDDIANTMRVQATFSGLTGTTTVAHIHSATAVPGVGTVGVATTTPTFPGFPSGVTGGTYDQTFNMTLVSSYNGSFLTANGGSTANAQIALFNGIKSGSAYFNLHTTAFPGGEIRGFFVSVPEKSSTLGFLALGTLGVASTFKRKLKPSKPSSKEITKVS